MILRARSDCQGARKKIAEKLRDGAEECGFSVNVAVASNADTAMLAALVSKGVTVIKDGEEAEAWEICR